MKNLKKSRLLKSILSGLLSVISISLSACANEPAKAAQKDGHAVSASQASEKKESYVKGELLVRFKDSLSEAEFSEEKRKAAYLLDAKNNIFAVEAERIGKGRLFRITLPKDFDLNEAIKILMETKRFKYVEKNQKFNIMSGGLGI